MAAALQARGVNRGDHVAVLGPTTAKLVTSMQAVWLCGATLVVLPLPMRLGSLEEFTTSTRNRIRLADSVCVLVDSDLAPFLTSEDGDPPMYLIGDLAEASQTADDFVRPDYHRDDLFVLQFTSGSTSEPKGVQLPNHLVAANLDAIYEAAEVTVENEVMVSWLPLYHDMGLVGFCILPMSAGLDLVLGAPQDFLGSPKRWMEWISTYGGTATAGPNFSYVLATRALIRSKETLDLSSLRIALNGAEPVDPVSVRRFIEAGERHGLRPGAIFPAFGMAEVGIAGAFPKPMAGMQTDIVDAELEDVVAKMRTIVRMAKPYKEIPKLPELREKFMNCYMRILEEQAEPVKDSINQDRNRVFEVLNTKSYKDAKFNRYLELFKEIMDGAEHCNNVSTLRSYADKAEALKLRLLNEMNAEDIRLAKEAAAKAEAERKRQEEEAEKRGETVKPAEKVAEPQPVYKVRTTKNVSIKTVAKTASWRLESKEDVDKYLAALRENLLKEMDEDTIVNIEL